MQTHFFKDNQTDSNLRQAAKRRRLAEHSISGDRGECEADCNHAQAYNVEHCVSICSLCRLKAPFGPC